MKQITKNLLLLRSIDPSASIEFSPYTEKFFVSTRIETSDGLGLLVNAGGDHRDVPGDAVAVTLFELQVLPKNHVIVTDAYKPTRTHWRWNGAAFVEIEKEQV